MPSSDLADVLAELRPGDAIVVRRMAPSYAKGFCGTHQMPEGGAWELVEQIERSWGGGTYVLQPRCRSPMYGNRFGPGACQIEIAGPSKHHGTPYGPDGRLVVSTPEPHQVVVQQSAPVPQANPMQSQLFALLQQLALRSDKGGSGGFQLGDVIELAKVMQPSAPASAPAAAEDFGQLERMVTMYAKLQRVFGRDAEERPSSGAGFGGFEGGMPTSADGMMQMMFMRMMMGGGNPGAGMPAGMPGMMGAPSQQSTMPQPPPVHPPAPAPAPAPAATNPYHEGRDMRAALAQDDEDRPPTADEIAEDLELVDVDQRASMLRSILERQPETVKEKLLEQLGLNPDKLDSMFRAAAQGMSAQADTGAGGWPRVPGG